MKFTYRGAACAIALTLALTPGWSLAWEKDKTYNLTILHTNDHHGHFWQSEQGEYGLAAQKTLVDRLRAEIAAEGGSVLLLSGGISIPEFRSPICRMPSPIFAV